MKERRTFQVEGTMHTKAEWLPQASWCGQVKDIFFFSFIEHVLMAMFRAKGLACFTSLSPHNNL